MTVTTMIIIYVIAILIMPSLGIASLVSILCGAIIKRIRPNASKRAKIIAMAISSICAVTSLWAIPLAFKGDIAVDPSPVLYILCFMFIGYASLFHFLLSKFIFKNTDVDKVNIWLMCIVIAVIVVGHIFSFIMIRWFA